MTRCCESAARSEHRCPFAASPAARPTLAVNAAAVGDLPTVGDLPKWSLFDRDGRARGVGGTIRPPGGDFRPPRILEKRRGSFRDLAVSPRGAALAAWQHTTRAGGVGRLWAAYLPAGARWFARPQHASPPLPHRNATRAKAAVDPPGRVLLVAWARGGDPGDWGVFVAEGRGHRPKRASR